MDDYIRGLGLYVGLFDLFLHVRDWLSRLRDDEGNTPLHIAHQNVNGQYFAWLLIEKGADVNAKNKMKETPLHTWLRAKPLPSVIFNFIQHGADVNAKSRSKVTPLHVALSRSDSSESIVSMLLTNGADVNAVDANGMTPLRYAHVYKAEPGIVLMLLKHGSYVNMSFPCGDFYYDWESAAPPNSVSDNHSRESAAPLPSVSCNQSRGSAAQLRKGLAVEKKLIKHSFINYPVKSTVSADHRLDLSEMNDKDSIKVLEQHKRRCKSEVSRIKNDILSGGVSLWNFLVRDKLMAPTPYPRGIFREVHGILRQRRYPLYQDVLRRTVEMTSHQIFLNILVQNQVHALSCTSGKVVLNEICLASISRYLSKSDLFNMAVAFDGKPKPIYRNKRKFKGNGPASRKRTKCI